MVCAARLNPQRHDTGIIDQHIDAAGSLPGGRDDVMPRACQMGGHGLADTAAGFGDQHCLRLVHTDHTVRAVNAVADRRPPRSDAPGIRRPPIRRTVPAWLRPGGRSGCASLMGCGYRLIRLACIRIRVRRGSPMPPIVAMLRTRYRRRR